MNNKLSPQVSELANASQDLMSLVPSGNGAGDEFARRVELIAGGNPEMTLEHQMRDASERTQAIADRFTARVYAIGHVAALDEHYVEAERDEWLQPQVPSR